MMALSMLVMTLLLTGAWAPRDRAEHVAQEEKRFEVSGTPDLQVSTFDGRIRIEAWDRSEVLFQVEKRGRDQTETDRIEIIASRNGDEIRFAAKMDGRAGWNSRARADIVIHVPRQASLTAHSGDGNIEARGLSGRISLTTGDGNVNASNLAGSLNVKTGDGRVELTDVSGALQAQTGDGRMQIRGRFTSLEAGTGDGSLIIFVEPGSRMESAWSLRTGDGSIQLSLPDDFSAELDAHASDGSISTDLPVVVAGKLGSTLRGRLNQGGHLLTVRTGDGSITLRRN